MDDQLDLSPDDRDDVVRMVLRTQAAILKLEERIARLEAKAVRQPRKRVVRMVGEDRRR